MVGEETIELGFWWNWETANVYHFFVTVICNISGQNEVTNGGILHPTQMEEVVMPQVTLFFLILELARKDDLISKSMA